MTINKVSLCGALLAACLTLPIKALDLDVDTQSSLSLSIYNDQLALVNDIRSVNLPAGITQLNWRAVSPLMNHASAILQNDSRSLQVLEQSYREITTPEDMLAQAVGQTVTLVSTHPVTGEQTREQAKILAVEGGLIFEIDGQYETDLAGRRIIYDTLPEGVLTPTLSAMIKNDQAQDNQLKLSYLTGGLSWRADYIAQLNEDQDQMQLQALATLENHSGISFSEAHVEFIAGAVNQVRERAFGGAMQKRSMATMAMEQDVATPTPLADFHLYSLPGRYTLPAKASKQIGLFRAPAVPVKREYQLSGQPSFYYSPNMPEQVLKIDSFIEFSNIKDQQLGLPMPAGIVRVYQRKSNQENNSASSGLRFIGEDRIKHTPAKAQVRLKTGQVFDLNATRRQIAFRRLPVQQPYRNHSEVEIETELTNAKDQTVTVNIEEHFSGEWSLVQGPEPHESNARSAIWAVEVPANGEATLRITIRVKS